MSVLTLPPDPVMPTLFEPGSASISFTPNVEFFESTSVLGLLELVAPALIDDTTELIASLSDVDGSLVFGDGFIVADLTTPTETIVQTIDVLGLIADIGILAADADGFATLSDGILSGGFSLGDDLFDFALDLAQLAGDAVVDILDLIEFTAPFADGEVVFTTATPLGDVTGAIALIDGGVSYDLVTDLGTISGFAEFSDAAQIPVELPVMGGLTATIDLSAGDIVIPLLGSDLTLPIDALAGTLSVSGGVASIEIPFMGTMVETSFEVGPLASEYVASTIASWSGTAELIAGIFSGSLVTDFGLVEGDFDVIDFLAEAALFAEQVMGTATIADGQITASLDTPLGGIDDTFSVSDLPAYLALPFGELV